MGEAAEQSEQPTAYTLWVRTANEHGSWLESIPLVRPPDIDDADYLNRVHATTKVARQVADILSGNLHPIIVPVLDGAMTKEKIDERLNRIGDDVFYGRRGAPRILP